MQPEQPDREQHGLLPQIQILRALAALSVFTYHYTYYFRLFLKLPENDYWFFGSGVYLFFVISGYVLWHSSDTPREFLLRRVLRIYPGFLLAVALWAFLRFPFGGIYVPPLQSLALLPTGPALDILQVEWTLHYEMSFYLLLAVAMGLPQAWRKYVPATWMLVLLVSIFGLHTDYKLFNYATHGIMRPYFHNVYLSSLCFSFALGMIARQLDAVKMKRTLLLAVSLPFFFLAFCVLPAVSQSGYNFTIGCAFFFIVLAAVRTEFSPGRIVVVLKRIGDWSYGIYLIHVTAIRVIIGTLPVQSAIPLWRIIILIIPALGCAILYGRFEWKIHTRIKKMLSGRQRS